MPIADSCTVHYYLFIAVVNISITLPRRGWVACEWEDRTALMNYRAFMVRPVAALFRELPPYGVLFFARVAPSFLLWDTGFDLLPGCPRRLRNEEAVSPRFFLMRM